MNVIVTGANGFIGRSLINKLIKDNNEVYAIDISFENNEQINNEHIHKFEISLFEVYNIRNELPLEVDVFYHLAWRGVNGKDKSNPFIQNKNIEMALCCAKLAKEIKCKKFLCSGTIAEKSIESLPTLDNTSCGMIYGSAKYCTRIMLETFCKNIGLNFVWMQFSNIYGPKNKTGNIISYTLNEILNNREALFGPALQPYDFIYIDDLVEAVYRLGKKKLRKNFYYIGSGKPKILKDYLIEIGKNCNKESLIKIGAKSDDGIKYSYEMFNIEDLIEDIGNYISGSFSKHIKNTIENYEV